MKWNGPPPPAPACYALVRPIILSGWRRLSIRPLFLWCRGDPGLAEGSVLALIGARNASSSGLRFARTLAEDLGANGHVIASGLASGIDAAAHKAALPTGTIGVLAGGVDFIYPAEKQKIVDQMAETGLILLEAPMGLEPQGRHFPR